MKYLGIITFILFLSGCQSSPATYNPSALPKNKLAMLTTKSVGFLEDEVQAMIVGVYDMDGKQLIGYTSPFEQDRWETVNLEAGTYKIVAICMLGNSYAHPRTIQVIEAGAKYEFKCITEYTKSFLGMDKPDKASLKIQKI
ncbi:hypothetical protein [Thalassotalea mangrovi]|uniref:Lipoprotein n=1 Tax=Thalassotalea mangrovi TaxID=2572245 RepID=A0A4U1B3A5_9GAMM|nr:hypothetical protein [Thalassotalea mangrovi]TKB44394.1 hypothetical protein E8M12_12130 [Thalassotalea mangrovi]